MSSGSLHEPVRPRAASYGRGNQAAGRYQRRPPATATVPATAGSGRLSRLHKARNRRRLWLFLAVILVAAVAGAATIAGALAQPATTLARPPVPATPGPDPEPPPTGGATPATAGTTDTPPRRTAGGEPAGTGAAGGEPTGTGAPGGRAAPTAPAGAGPQGGGAGGGTTPPSSGPTEPSGGGETVVYKNCAKARKAGAAPLYRGEPGYTRKLDRDGDGVACDKNDT